MLGLRSPEEARETCAGLFEADVDIVAERLDEELASSDVTGATADRDVAREAEASA